MLKKRLLSICRPRRNPGAPARCAKVAGILRMPSLGQQQSDQPGLLRHTECACYFDRGFASPCLRGALPRGVLAPFELRALSFILAIASCVASCVAPAAAQDVLYAEVTLDKSAAVSAAGDKPLTGRIFLFFSHGKEREPRFGPNWFKPEPFFRLDVEAIEPGDVRRIDDSAAGFPKPLSKLPAGAYRVQALLDHDPDSQHYAQSGGNLYSQVLDWRHDPASPEPLRLTLDQIVPPRKFVEKPWLKEIRFKSKSLSEFHGREVLHLAAVVLPAGYDRQPERRYPAIYTIPGFGGTHYDAMRGFSKQPPAAQEGETDFIRVMLSADCGWGHHVFADSATNGPRGEALVNELIPYIDAHFRTVAAPTARFVTGHSSGGWSSLWVQVRYPDVFGGVWSTAPDPVDFRDWQQVDLYARPRLSLYVDQRSERRPIARMAGKPVLWYGDFAKMDDVLGRGCQLRSFEAAFSPLDAAGEPRQMWDRTTGRVDPEVVKAWEAHDIRLYLERHWDELAPKLRGKLHVITGEVDTFYLEGAVRLLGESLKALGSDAEVSVVAGKDHGNLLTPELVRQIRRQMSVSFLKHHPTP